MHLLHLPPEILLEILGHFDSLSSLHAFSSLCRSAYLLKKEASEQLYRQLCFSLGYTDVTSYGASTAIDTQWRGGWHTSHRDPGLELQEAIARQNSLRKTSYLHYVRRWEMLAQMRDDLDRSWREGDPMLASTPIERGGPPGGIHRFKLDPDCGIYLTTGVDAGVGAFDVNGSAKWISGEPTTMYPHIEFRCVSLWNPANDGDRAQSVPVFMAWSYSQGYFGCMSGEKHIIWRRSDILTPKAPISKACEKFLKSRSFHMGSPGDPEFRPFAEIAAPGSLNATKMRHPYFIGSSNQRRALYRFDYCRGTMTMFDISRLWQTIGEDALADSMITYVEILDRDHVVVAGRKSVTLWHPERGCVALFPPVAPALPVVAAADSGQGPSMHPRAHYRLNDKSPTWTAVHHDLRHGHLIATSVGERGVTGSGKLMWIPKWKTLIDGAPDEVEDTTVVLTTNAAIIQLSVENERAVFVTQDFSTNICALWLLHLRPFTSLEDFKKDPPVPMCLLFPLPCTHPPARIEMTIDEIMFPCCSELMPNPRGTSSEDELATWYQRILRLAQGLKPVDMRWESLSAQTLWKDPGKPEPASGSPSNDRDAVRAVEKQWSSILAEVDGTMDSIFSVSFGTQFWLN